MRTNSGISIGEEAIDARLVRSVPFHTALIRG